MMRKRSDRRRIHVALFPSLSIPAVAALAFSVAGCESLGLSTPSLPAVPSLFGEKKEEKLPGKRISVLSSGDREGIGGVEAAGPIMLPPAIVNASWSQPGGV